MSALFSASWYRTAELVPRLRTQARIYRHVYRGEVWRVVQDQSSGKFLRLNAQAYRILGLMDGQRNLEQIWQLACETMGDDVPGQDEILQLMTQLHNAGVLITGQVPDLDELRERTRESRRNRIKQYLSNPLALRIPLIDPDRFLQRLVGWIPAWMHSVILACWALLVAFGGWLAFTHWEGLTSDVAQLVFTPQYVVTLLLVFPLVKAVHELGHGIAIKLFGGQCHEMGVMLLVMMPVPYVDASHATGFVSKYRRMIVGAAGMMIELALAAVALWVWTWTEPGLLRVFLHDVVILAGVTTVIFNLNPLLRFDGYYILSDWLEIPGLGQKANQYLGYLCKRYLLRIRRGLQPPRTTPREPGWLTAYAIGSFCYRMVLVFTIVMFVATQFFIIGIVLALWAIYMMLLLPLIKLIKNVMHDPLIMERRMRLYSLVALGIGGLVWCLALTPVPSATLVEGVVWMPEQSRIRAPQNCFVRELLQEQGMVRQGQPLIRCEDDLLPTRLAVLEQRRKEVLARQVIAQRTDRVEARLLEEELISIQTQVDDLKQRIANFTLVAPMDGRFVVPGSADLEGRWFQRGAVVGHIIDPERYTVMSAVPQMSIDRVRADSRQVRLRPVGDIEREVTAHVLRAVPSATKRLPSLALALQGGGTIGIEPGEQEALALEPLFLLELKAESDQPISTTLGGRVYARFEHTPEPLAMQWYRVLRDLFIRKFGV
ncbi:PqqD family peptide modification chaperone [Marinobacterium sediminicola]|uniref:Peptide zinc metalloprotease protein n=1 Tax=Marinobacterium sediminicola TaxID=518898 RepID=A0ABY1S3M2_9GAMM|nr:PqqD family peptide modification chaperone [Marinobacterium sediminicola]ULG68279.1 PqqD family peptide modification chaperone [Marinobacterium sediminicola]SMR77751.1 putative peptide zinc metalloprotease protein [Marinobacterium sediminicola]